MYGESNMETYITICKTDSQREFAVCLRKLKQGLCINLEGWDGERDGREVREGGDICIRELLIAKFRLKLKKVGETTRPFRYDLNQSPVGKVLLLPSS